MQRNPLARWLVVGALAAFVLLLGAGIASAATPQGDTSVQGTNTSSDTTGASGDVAVANTATVSGGPSAAASDGSVATSSTKGDTSANLSQNSSGASGPAAAGSQVNTPGAGSDTQGTNVSRGATAVSGPVTVTSDATVKAGPSSVSSGPGSVASTTQDGDVNVFARQVGSGLSGPAVAGSQFAVGNNGDALTQNTNVSEDDLALSGGVDVFNLLAASAGPAAGAFDGGIAVTTQAGDDDAFLQQVATGTSGGAFSGSQATGNSRDDVQNTNASSANTAATGPVTSGNALAAAAGPSSSASGAGSVSSTSHDGDTAVVSDQIAGARSGNSVVGSQLTGLSGFEEKLLDVVNQQASEVDFHPTGTIGRSDLASGSGVDVLNTNVTDGNTGVSGAAASLNDAVAVAGPSSSTVTAATAGPLASAAAGTATAVTTMDGDATTFVNQVARSDSGDTTVASQDVRVPTQVGTVDVQDFNRSSGSLGFSGDALSSNAGVGASGPSSSASSTATAEDFGIAASGDATAVTSQDGDTNADLTQLATSRTGAADSGSQSEHVRAEERDNVHVQNTNVADTAFVFTGDATSANVGEAIAGATSEAASTAAADAFGLATAGDAVGATSQDGDADALLEQIASSTSGDGSAGSQSDGIRTRGDRSRAEVLNTNITDGATAFSGNARSENFGAALAGPGSAAVSLATATGFGISLAGDAVASGIQDGNARVLGVQTASTRTGDVASGSQDTEIDAGSEVSVEDTNVASAPLTISGDALGSNLGSWLAGSSASAASTASTSGFGTASSDDATAVIDQHGDNDALFTQVASVSTGGALAGSQRNRIRARDARVHTQDTNVADASTAISGPGIVVNDAVGATGPVATAASAATAGLFDVVTIGPATAVAEQDGDNRSLATQVGSVHTGDTFAGSQIKAIDARDNVVRTEATNVSDDAFAFSGAAGVFNALGAQIGTIADAAPTGTDAAVAVADQSGDNRLISTQVASGRTGTVGAGSQVIAYTGSEDQFFQVQNITAAVGGVSGSVFGLNAVLATAGTPASSTGGVAVVTQDGDNGVNNLQTFSAASGNAFFGVQLEGNAVGSAIGLSGASSASTGELELLGTLGAGTTVATTSGEFASVEVGGGLGIL